MAKENRRRDALGTRVDEKENAQGTLDDAHERVEQGDRYIGWRYQT